MKPATKPLLLATSIAVLTSLLSTEALSQGAEPAVTTRATWLEEIIVTARKREESSQEIPVSIMVSTGEDLQRASVKNFIDLQQSTPTLNVMSAALSDTSVNVAMRGNALVDIRLNVDPVVGVYMDGVYLPRNQGTNASDLYDIERIETLAGPQATLYGKNTSGGAINIFTKMPVDSFEGSMRVSYAEHDDRQMAGMINIPISDTLATRIVASLRGRDGYGTNAFDGSDVGALSSQNWRATALWTPSDDLQVTLRGDYAQADTQGAIWKGFQELRPNGVTVLNTSLATGLSMADAFAYLQTFAGGDKDDGNANLARDEEFKSWGVSATIDWDINDNLAFKSITALRKFKREGTVDLDGTPLVILEYPLMKTSDEQVSQEFQLLGTSFDGRLNWVTGLYYSEEVGDEEIHQVALGFLTGGVPAIQRSEDITSESFGVFAQGTYAITDALSTTIGLRYTEDKRSLDQMNRSGPNCLSLGLPLASIGGAANCVRPESVSFEKVMYTVGLEYRPWQDLDVMLYAKTSRGYRAGGLQQTAGAPTQVAADFANQPFDPETVEDFEVGIKSTWMDNRLLANLTFFTSEIDDIIRVVSAPVPGTAIVATAVQNAAVASVDGVEWLLRFMPVTGLELRYAGTYMDASFDKYITPTGEDRSALPLLFTPEWRHSLSAIYSQDTSFGEWRAQLDWMYTAKQLAAEREAYAPAYDILNGRLSLFFQEHDFEIALFGKNIADERYFPYPVDVLDGLGFMYNGYANPPRTIGVEFNIHF